MPLRFTKMHGLGNDYVYISLFDQHVHDPAALARTVSDRQRGVGADGLILLAPPDQHNAHVRMIVYNADGSRAEMCGNGVRCVAKLAYEHGLATNNPLSVQTDCGVITLDLTTNPAGRVTAIRADMGPPILTPKLIPVTLPGDQVVECPITVAGHELLMTSVSLGNPHAVVFVDDLSAVPLGQWGPAIERHELFPSRVNAHFAQVMNADHLRMLTWERGSGPTMACGTGACAVCVAGVMTDRTARRITADLTGGTLEIEWNSTTDHVFMTGPAVEVFTGQLSDD